MTQYMIVECVMSEGMGGLICAELNGMNCRANIGNFKNLILFKLELKFGR